jgi:hypothetical protein
MSDTIQIIAKHIVDGNEIEEVVVFEKEATKVSSIEELGFNHKEQIDILSGCQEALLKAQSTELFDDIDACPKCKSKLKFAGNVKSSFHSVFTDHKVPVKRKKCCNKNCGWTSVPSIASLFNTNSHPDLSKLQTEMSAKYTYRHAQNIMNAMSCHKRKVNNHNHLHNVVEVVGNYIHGHLPQDISSSVAASDELIVQVDGGHLKTKDPKTRSFEALTSIVYNAKNIKYTESKKQNELESSSLNRAQILSKHCAASALDDNLQTIKKQTLLAAQKQGMTVETKVTALCDGAANCWSVVNSLEDHCLEITKILDWFHIGMKFQNISLSKLLEEKLEKIKWCVWHGLSDDAFDRLNEIIPKITNEKMQSRVIKLKNYLVNNKKHLVNYAERYKNGKLISSSVAESNVESLINQRCKGQKHMKWTREGVHPLLQIRAAIASNDWNIYGDAYVLNATTQAAKRSQ